LKQSVKLFVIFLFTNIQTLVEEGAAIVAFKLVRNGEFQEEGITELLQAPGRSEA
jgi:N-methylhydantoinase B/oxoprolinase/acetone carboxylase alpha subunit